ncbi:MAG: family 10 glycosylhydrolase [Candidatus Marinimicrobia bacterium]|nr:family 10 glycosylhydrolase [Candidatus Neomarinimicrobiota bacterium]
MKTFKIHISRAAIVALLFILNPGLAQDTDSYFQQRCLWVVRSNITTAKAIDKLLQFSQINKFNHLIVQVRGRGDAYYNSTLVVRARMLRNATFDPLAYLIQKAHLRGIKVHAWVNVYLVWSDKSVPYSTNHILYQHPEWLDIPEAGRMQASELVRNMERLREGHEGLYLSPGHPDVPDHLLKVFREIVEKYDIDGLHLDYIRYQDADFGRNPIARQIYERYNGDDPWVLLSSHSRWRGNEKQYVSRLRKWNDYRRYSVTDLVKQIHLMVKDIRPECILSAAVKPNLYQARDNFFQEWDVWLAAGYLDWAFPMNYTQNLRDFASNIESIYDNIPSKYRDRIMMGLAAYNQPSDEVVDKLKYTRITRFTGVCLFSYNTFKQNPDYIQPIHIEINK